MKKYIGGNRLNSYKADNNYEEYTRNIDESLKVYPYLHVFEVSLRNRLDSFIAESVSANWIIDYLSNESGTVIKLPTHMKNDLYNCFKRITNSNDDIVNINQDILLSKSHDDFISNLYLGFWVEFFNKEFLRLNGIEHSDILSYIFNENVSQLRNNDIKKILEDIYAKLNKIRKLRNRVCHFERILNCKHTNYMESISVLKKVIKKLDKDDVLYKLINKCIIH